MKPQTFVSLFPFLSAPRPNGSRSLTRTVEAVQAWLENKSIPVHSHRFTLRPCFMELLGLWLGSTGLLLPVAALARWGWGGLILTLLALGIPLLEIRFLCPAITLLVRQPAQNLIAFFPASHPTREALFCAHLDSKTELLDHYRRQILLRLSLPAMALALVCEALIAAETIWPAEVLRWLAFLTGLPAAVYGLGMGANLVGGRFSRRPSTGAVDNGAAVAALLALARQLHRRELGLEHTAVTLLFTVGEEAQMQGALAYVRDRKEWPLPAQAVNLEVLGQNGGYLLWEEDGTVMQRMAVDPALNRALERAVEAVTGKQPVREKLNSSDACAFLQQGIPAATLGSFDAALGNRGLHSAMDHPGRVDPDRLNEAVVVLGRFLTDLDKAQAV